MQSKKLYVETPVGGEYPPRKNKTIFAASKCADIVTMDEASVEHPMSTRSASDETSWKPAGNTAIIRCMAAMFVMLFTLGVSNMWGASFKLAINSTIGYSTNSTDTVGWYGNAKSGAYSGAIQYNFSNNMKNYAKKNVNQKFGRTQNTTNNNCYVSASVAARRGWKFTGWGTVTSKGTTRIAKQEVIDSIHTDKCYYHLYGVAGNASAYSSGATITANAMDTFFLHPTFVKAEKKSVTVKTKADRGAITGLVYYNMMNMVPKSSKDPTLIASGFKLGSDDLTFTGINDETGVNYELWEEDRISLTAEPAEGCSFIGWFSVASNGTKTLITADVTLLTVVSEDVTYYAEFMKIASTVVSEKSGTPSVTYNFNSLEDAISYANNNATDGRTKTILIRDNCTLQAGTYTIPVNTTLLVPYKAEQTAAQTSVERVSGDDVPTPSSAYCTLTLNDGVHIDVYGAIEVGGAQWTGLAGAEGAIGIPAGPTYGQMIMNAGSSITMNNNSQFRGWGYVTGQGSIDVRRGAVVRELFQVNDLKGMEKTLKYFTRVNDTCKVLPISQYFIQNVEVPTTFRPGSRLKAQCAVSVGGVAVAVNDVGIIGVRYSESKKDSAMFLMDDADVSEDTWVRKSYDVDNDVQLYEVNNAAYLGSLILRIELNKLLTPQVLAMYGFPDVVNVNSAEYTLPITNNFKIHLLSGVLTVTQDTELFPGSIMECEKKSTIIIPDAVTLAMYDSEQWGKFVSTLPVDAEYVYAHTVKYRPGLLQHKRTLTPAGLGDAQLIVHGTIDVRGSLRSTIGDVIASNPTVVNIAEKGKPAVYQASATITENPSPTIGGATISSTIADAGTIIFTNAAPDIETSNIMTDFAWQVSAVGSTLPVYEGVHLVPALLKNDAGSQFGAFSQTANTPAHQSYCFVDMDGDGQGEWVSMTEDGCFSYDNYGVYYIKPRAYVPISLGVPAEEADHTYRDHYAGTGKIFIQLPECQWWEVEAVPELPGVYHCTHPQNNTTYYYYNGNEWTEKRFKVTWKNWDGSALDEPYQLTYKTTPKYLGSTPQRAASDYYTYDFDGWTPEIVEVTKDTTYTAKYIQTDRKYLITFQREADDVIETQYVAVGEVPTCLSYSLETNEEWSPALSAVTGDATYTLTTADPLASSFTITFVNWDGTPLQSGSVTKGETPSAPSDDPTKAELKDEQYSFIGWKAANGTVYASNALPAATENASYTATFSASARKYTIKFVKENGNPETPADVLSTQSLDYGATPVLPNPLPTKEATAQYTYSLVWSPLVGSVTGHQNYTATFKAQTRQYTVTWKNYDGTTLAVDYVNYNAAAEYSGLTPVKPSDATYAYTFTGWNTTPAEQVTADVVYTAQFSSAQKTLEVVGTETLSDDKTLETVHVQVTGVLNVGANKTLEADYLILESNGTTTGQIIPGAGASLTAANAYFDLSINAESHKWYGVAVPWPVNATNGISVNGKTLVLGKDFDIIYYDGARRAVEGKQKCWKYVENDGDKTLQPGRLYMIGLMMDAPTIRFAKKAYASLLTTSTSVTAHPQTTGDDKDANWNGVANPALFHAFVNAGANDVTYGPNIGQVYNPDTKSYSTINMSAAKFVVGQGAFVQGPNAGKAITVTYGGAYAAPRRARAEEAPLYDVRIAPAEGNYTDRLFVTVDDEKEADTYVIGKDLAKLGVSKSVAQMWINRYNTELCLNTMTMENGVAEYPLSIFAPKAGEYTITNEQSSMSNEYTLYLTFNGEAIWNLSDAAYTGTFDAGTTSAYGLRISARAPQITTGIDEAVVDAKGETRKVLIDNQVFIIRGENVYSVDGQLVK